jgi:photosystem II stability/assembly factor-like uncharacterized protein
MRTKLSLVLVLCAALAACTPKAVPVDNTEVANENAAPAVVDTTATVPYDFRAVDFLDISNGWVVGSDDENNVSVVAHTVNGGANWVVLVELVGDTLLDIDFADEKNGWTVGMSGLTYETNDGGRTWTPTQASAWTVERREKPFASQARNPGDVAPSINESIAAIRFVDARTGWAAGEAPAGKGIDVRGLVLGTTDGGATWTELKDAAGAHAPFTIVDLFAVSATDAWAVGGDLENREEDVLLHSVDGARTWERVKTGTAQYLRAVHFVDANHGWVVGMTGTDFDELGPSKVLATADGGKTWTVQYTAPRSFFDVQFANAQRGWAVGDRASIWATTDGGVTWRQQVRFQTNTSKTVQAPRVNTADPEQRALRSVFAFDAASVWVGGEGTILRRVKK